MADNGRLSSSTGNRLFDLCLLQGNSRIIQLCENELSMQLNLPVTQNYCTMPAVCIVCETALSITHSYVHFRKSGPTITKHEDITAVSSTFTSDRSICVWRDEGNRGGESQLSSSGGYCEGMQKREEYYVNAQMTPYEELHLKTWRTWNLSQQGTKAKICKKSVSLLLRKNLWHICFKYLIGTFPTLGTVRMETMEIIPGIDRNRLLLSQQHNLRFQLTLYPACSARNDPKVSQILTSRASLNFTFFTKADEPLSPSCNICKSRLFGTTSRCLSNDQITHRHCMRTGPSEDLCSLCTSKTSVIKLHNRFEVSYFVIAQSINKALGVCSNSPTIAVKAWKKIWSGTIFSPQFCHTPASAPYPSSFLSAGWHSRRHPPLPQPQPAPAGGLWRCMSLSCPLQHWKTLGYNITWFSLFFSSRISGHAIPHHLYADKTKLYVSFSSGDSAAALNVLQSCLASVQSWMLTNKLKLNPGKTEFLLIGNERQRSKYLSMFPIELLVLKLTQRNLLAILEWSLTKSSTSAHKYPQSALHVFTTSGIYGVFAVTLIWTVQNWLVNALVSSRFDYCNSLLSGIVETDLTKAPTCFEPSGSCGHKATTIYSKCSTAALPSLTTSKI